MTGTFVLNVLHQRYVTAINFDAIRDIHFDAEKSVSQSKERLKRMNFTIMIIPHL